MKIAVDLEVEWSRLDPPWGTQAVLRVNKGINDISNNYLIFKVWCIRVFGLEEDERRWEAEWQARYYQVYICDRKLLDHPEITLGLLSGNMTLAR